jgi:hypothetical protein
MKSAFLLKSILFFFFSFLSNAIDFDVTQPSAGMRFMTGSQISIEWKMHNVTFPIEGIVI